MPYDRSYHAASVSQVQGFVSVIINPDQMDSITEVAVAEKRLVLALRCW